MEIGRLLLVLLLLAAPIARGQFVFATNNGVVSITSYTGAGGEVDIPDFVNVIAPMVFDQQQITSVTIPTGITNIGGVSGDPAFFSCTLLTNITVDPQNAVYSSVNGVLFDKTERTLLVCPAGLTGSYTVPNGVASLGSDAFLSSSLNAVIVPASLTDIQNALDAPLASLSGIYFMGNAPNATGSAGLNGQETVFYLPGTVGWSAMFDGDITASWVLPYPVILGFGPDFGLRLGGISFDVSWALSGPVVVQACTNLANPNWQPLATNSLVNGVANFIDSQFTNFPQRFYRAVQTSIYVGNSLSVDNGGSDSDPPFVILGEYNPAGPPSTSPITLPAGTVRDVRFYGQGYDFTLYALSLVTNGPNANEQTFQVVAAQSFSGFASSEGVQILPVTGFQVSAGNLLAFAGTGPFYPQVPNDVLDSDATYEDSANPNSFTATAPGGAGTQFTVGINPDPAANYEYVSDYFQNQGRTYAIGVDVLPQ